MKWNDYRVTFTEPGVHSVRFSDASFKFWKPDLFFKNAVETKQMKTIYPEDYIQVGNNGNILYSTR